MKNNLCDGFATSFEMLNDFNKTEYCDFIKQCLNINTVIICEEGIHQNKHNILLMKHHLCVACPSKCCGVLSRDGLIPAP